MIPPNPPKTPNSPSLEVISRGPEETKPADDRERRRLARLNVSSEQFRLSVNGKVFSVSDLSVDGMALRVLDREDLVLFAVGSELEGVLNLRREKFSVRAKLRHLLADLVGCQFLELPPKTSEALESFLDPAILGRELRPIPSSGEGALWYHAPSGTDLLFWRGTDGQYRRFALFLLGNYVQWESEGGLATGQASPADSPSEVRGVIRFETMLLKPDSQPDAAKLSVAKTLILSSNLPQDLKKWCSRLLQLPQ